MDTQNSKMMASNVDTAGNTNIPEQPSPIPTQLTGAIRMGVTFNPGRDHRIDQLKAKFAELHDLITELSNEHINSIHGTSIMRSEAGRACATSLTHLQTSKMFAVEALTR